MPAGSCGIGDLVAGCVGDRICSCAVCGGVAMGPMHCRNHSEWWLSDTRFSTFACMRVVGRGVVHRAVVAGCGSCVRTGYTCDTYIDPMVRDI